MEKEEKYIETAFGRKAPFKVPEGYFDDFTARMMDRLPVADEGLTVVVCDIKPLFWKRYRKVVVTVAASVCIGMVGVGAYLHHEASATGKEHVAGAEVPATSFYSSADALTDYAMLDSNDMYAYMADIK